MIGLRKLASAKGMEVPQNLLAMESTLIDRYNISGDANEARLIWSENLNEIAAAVKPKRQADTVYFVGCVSSFFPVAYSIPQSLVQIMMNLGEDFTILGSEERCCGYPLYSAGMEEQLFSFAEHNMATVKAAGARRLVVTCPSCPPFGQERGQVEQDPSGDAVLAAKGKVLFFGPVAVEPTHRLFPQIEPQVDRGHIGAHPHGTGDVAEAILVGACAVVEKPIDRLQMASVLVFLAQGIVDVDVDNLGRTDALPFGDEPGHLMSPQGRSHRVGLPGADAQAIGHIA